MGAPRSRAAFERAVRDGQLLLHYQPKISLARGEVVGAEALVRWNDGGEIVPPDIFLPLAEESGMLHDITLGLLDEVAAAAAALRAVRPGLALSINVAPDDLAENRISGRIGELLASGAIDHRDLEIEITESAVMGNFEKVRDDLERLGALGIRVMMDDFGTGYSSIDRLSRLPFGALKLDKGVVGRMGSSRRNLEVVKASLSMARELGMTSVAEGVESAGTYDFLIANGCEEAQGFWIARPMSLGELERFVVAPHGFAGSEIGRVHQAILNLLHFRKCLIDAAFCSEGARRAPDSVMDPGLGGAFEDSRLGLWYYGSGQRLARHAAFRAIEAPLRRVHEDGNRLLEALAAGRVEDAVLVAGTAGIDARVERLIALMHTLERELLATR